MRVVHDVVFIRVNSHQRQVLEIERAFLFSRQGPPVLEAYQVFKQIIPVQRLWDIQGFVTSPELRCLVVDQHHAASTI